MILSTEWFLLQFKPNSHHLAKRNLSRQGFRTFLPMQEITKREFNRYVNHLRPLFPGYMFVAFDPESSPWRQVNCTIGVSRIVSFGGQPQSVPHNLVTGLMQRCDASGKLLPTKELNKGDEVQLLTGPFANYIAKVETIDAKERVWVLMEFMGQVTRTSVEKNQLKTLT